MALIIVLRYACKLEVGATVQLSAVYTMLLFLLMVIAIWRFFVAIGIVYILLVATAASSILLVNLGKVAFKVMLALTLLPGTLLSSRPVRRTTATYHSNIPLQQKPLQQTTLRDHSNRPPQQTTPTDHANTPLQQTAPTYQSYIPQASSDSHSHTGVCTSDREH